MKKLASRGFTLVELMIVIAIIGILAAVLYPALTGYFERSRDTNRQGALRNISLALSSYNIDNSKYPDTPNSKCVQNVDGLVGVGKLQTIPKDPRNGFGVKDCEDKGGYGYRTIKLPGENNASGNAYMLVARMEVQGNANFEGSDTWHSDDNLILGSGALKDANTKGTLSGSVTPEKWYYAVAQ